MKVKTIANIFHADCFGLRETKNNYLNNTLFQDVKWKKVNCEPDFYLFKPSKSAGIHAVDMFDVSKLFIESVAGFKTHRDYFAVAFDKYEIDARIRDMQDNNISDVTIKTKYKLNDTGSWKIADARKRIGSHSVTEIRQKTTCCQYRILDCRWCYLDDAFMDRPRALLMDHVANKENYVFGVGRQGLAVGDIEWCLATVSKYPIDENIFRRGGVLVSPLYKYDTNIFGEKKTPNLKMEIVRNFENRTGLSFIAEQNGQEEKAFSPVDLLSYVYAVLYSHKYRKTFADELKIDYPKIPYPDNAEYFWKIVSIGAELIRLHTQEEVLDVSNIDFIDNGTNIIERYKLIDGKIYINKSQFFSSQKVDITSAWEYVIGGNQPLQKWLKDRKQMCLTEEDIRHYKENIVGISRTMDLMNRIDEIIEL